MKKTRLIEAGKTVAVVLAVLAVMVVCAQTGIVTPGP